MDAFCSVGCCCCCCCYTAPSNIRFIFSRFVICVSKQHRIANVILSVRYITCMVSVQREPQNILCLVGKAFHFPCFIFLWFSFPLVSVSFSLPCKRVYLFFMLYFLLQLKILIYAFFSLCAFICQRLVSYTHCTRRYQMQNDWEFLLLMLDFRLFVKIGRIGVCFHHCECWWLISWILNSENQFFFCFGSFRTLPPWFRLFLWIFIAIEVNEWAQTGARCAHSNEKPQH